MADIAAGVAAKLLNTPAVTAVVGTRVFPSWVRMADKAYPLIVYKVHEINSTQTYGGVDPLTSCTVEVAAIAATYADAVAAADTVRAALDGDTSTWGTVTVQGCFLADDGISDDVVNEPETEAILQFIREVQFTVWYVNA